MDRELIVNGLDFNMEYAWELMADVPDERIAERPGKGLENSPAFSLGHLCMAAARMVNAMGIEMDVPRHYSDLFDRKGPGDPRLPSIDRTMYPSKEELLNELSKQHELIKESLLGVSDNFLQSEITWRFSKHFKSRFELLLFMTYSHEGMHLAQIAAWRRAIGLDSAFARL